MALYHNIIANFAGRLWLMAATYIFVPIYIKILGAESYALIAFYTVLLTFASLADVGLSTTFAREAARTKDIGQLASVMTTMEKILFSAALLFSVIIFILSPVIADKWLNNIQNIDRNTVILSLNIMSLTIPLQMLITFYSAGLMGLQRQVSNNIIQSIYVAVRSFLVIPLLIEFKNIEIFFAWQLAVTFIFSFIFRMALLKSLKISPIFIGRFNFKLITPLLSFTTTMIVISVISSINVQVDKIFVSSFFSVKDFGFYAAASVLSQLPLAITMPIILAFYPKLTGLLACGNMAPAKALYDYGSQAIALVASILAGGLFFFAPEILTLWLSGAPYLAVLPNVVALLAIGSLLYGLQLSPYHLILGLGETRVIMYLTALAFVLTMPLSYISIRTFGMIGAPVPWVILNGLNFCTISWIANRRAWSRGYLNWLLAFTLLPCTVGLAAMALARIMANIIGAGPIGSGLVAALFSLIALLLYWWIAMRGDRAIPLASMSEVG